MLLNDLFENVVVINLDSRPDRMQLFDEQAQRLGLEYQRSSAVGKERLVADGLLGPNMDFGVKAYSALAGRIGCRMSHLACLRDAAARSGDTLIFEDDCVIKENADMGVLLDAPADWACLFLGVGFKIYDRNTYHDALYTRVRSAWGMHSYAVRPATAALLLEYLSTVFITQWDTMLRRLKTWDDPRLPAYVPTVQLTKQRNPKDSDTIGSEEFFGR